ncbi:MAG: UDP-2,3-diacylglucosamine diphosphatase [Verrucomicrobiota bacterium]
MKKTTLSFKTIFLSDVHLGTPDCKIDEVNHFLKHTHCETLILNGDIIDGWSLARKGGWTEKHTRFIRLVLKKLEKRGTEVLYLRGNHDDILTQFLPLFFGKLRIVNEHIHKGVKGDYLVVHGDGFDAVTMNHKWLAILGDIGYQTLLKINRVYNKYRSWRGKEYFSLSKAIKARVKSAVSFVGNYEEQLQNFARKRNCSGIICGHIHTPDNKMVGDIHYLNSGDWVESLTALVEYEDGNFEVFNYKEFCKRLDEKSRIKALKKAQAGGLELEDNEPDPVEEDHQVEAPTPFDAKAAS